VKYNSAFQTVHYYLTAKRRTIPNRYKTYFIAQQKNSSTKNQHKQTFGTDQSSIADNSTKKLAKLSN